MDNRFNNAGVAFIYDANHGQTGYTLRQSNLYCSLCLIKCFRACLCGGGEPQVGEVTHLGEVRLSICLLI